MGLIGNLVTYSHYRHNSGTFRSQYGCEKNGSALTWQAFVSLVFSSVVKKTEAEESPTGNCRLEAFYYPSLSESRTLAYRQN
jgi:hypothetical protein